MRHIRTPLYMFINQNKRYANGESSINYIVNNPFEASCSRGSGIAILNEVAVRFFRLYKVPAYRAIDVIDKMASRYRAGSRQVTDIHYEMMKWCGYIDVKDGVLTPTFHSRTVTNRRDDFIRKSKKQRKYKDVTETEFDLIVMTKEVEYISKLSKFELSILREKSWLN